MAVDITTWGTGSHAQLVGMRSWYRRTRFDILPPVIPGGASLTIKYFQRVYDDGTAGYCYYTSTSIIPTPASASTTPNITGNISDYSIVKILEIY